jgi:hypothetical protein
MPSSTRAVRSAAATLFAVAALSVSLPANAADVASLAVGTAPETTAPTNTLDYDRGGIFDEVRISAASWAQNNDGGAEGHFSYGGEVLFDPFVGPYQNWFLNIMLRPRPMAGLNLTPGGTNQIFAGLTWDVPVGPIFFEASFGGTLHDGDLRQAPGEPGGGLELGCRALFRESYRVGAKLGAHWRILAGLDHSSNAELCDDNNGMTHIGGMIGYQF